jgi:hypothetical protein
MQDLAYYPMTPIACLAWKITEENLKVVWALAGGKSSPIGVYKLPR